MAFSQLQLYSILLPNAIFTMLWQNVSDGDGKPVWIGVCPEAFDIMTSASGECYAVASRGEDTVTEVGVLMQIWESSAQWTNARALSRALWYRGRVQD
jgi:hypothetical protein